MHEHLTMAQVPISQDGGFNLSGTERPMRIDHVGSETKGWCFGPWNSTFGISVGYANQGIDEPHRHTAITEVYLVARGSPRVRIGRETFDLREGDVLTVEP